MLIFPLTVAQQYIPPRSFQMTRITNPFLRQQRLLSVYEFTIPSEQEISSGYYYNPPSGSSRLDINVAKPPYPSLRRLPPQPHKNFKIVYEGKKLEFTFPSEQERLAALADGRYNPQNVLPVDVDVYSPSKYVEIIRGNRPLNRNIFLSIFPANGRPVEIFITIPRFDKGSPYTLARVRNTVGRQGIQLEAFPSYAWHSSYGANCDGLTSIYRVRVREKPRHYQLYFIL